LDFEHGEKYFWTFSSPFCIILQLLIVYISLCRYNDNSISFQGDSKIMNGMTTKEAAEKWVVTPRQL
jgi:hypothetical protein